MSRPCYPVIQPLPELSHRPFWSVMIPAYNRTEYLERTLRSVLVQAPDADVMQIAVVDNASPTSQVEEIVQRVGGNRVEFFRQQSNIGLVNNWNSCIEHGRGQWIHILHDDDMVLPDFYSTYHKFIEEHADVALVLSRPLVIDAKDEWQHILQTPPSLQSTGVWENALFHLLNENPSPYLRCPSVVVARRAYESVGGFEAASIYTHDWQMWMRIAAKFEVGYVHQPLALYREHQQSITYSLVREQNVLKDMERTVQIGLALLPPALRAEARKGGDRTCASIAELYRWYVHEQKQHRMELLYTRCLYRHAPSVRNFLLVLKSWARTLKAQIARSRSV